MMIVPLVAVALLVQQADTAHAYADSVARRLVAGARARRETVDRSITAYDVTMRERIGVAIRALRRDRMLFRRELALRIEWRRDSVSRIEVLGARQAIPAALPTPAMPERLEREVPDYAFDPADDRLTIGFGQSRDVRDTSEQEDEAVRLIHPLAPGGEAHYRFAAGDSSAVVFASGRVIRLRELRVTPRRLEFRLLTGSFWIAEDSYAVVRAVIRPARPFDFEQDLEDEEDDDIPGFLKPIRAELRFLTIDYGLWEGRWWLPRLIAFDAVATAGSILTVPLRYERRYEDYEVTGDTTAAPLPRLEREVTLAEDSAARARCNAGGEGIICRCRNAACRAFAVHVPRDTAAVVASATLPAPFGAIGDTLLAAGDMEQLARDIGALPAPPWELRARPPRWGLARYNRVEGLALGARAEVEFGRLRADGQVLVATTDGTPDLAAGLAHEWTGTRVRLSGYHRLTAVDPPANPLGIGNSIAALWLGRDDGDYFRTTGVELTVTPVPTAAQRFGVRVWAERQRAVAKRTDFSIRRVLDADHRFRPNILADSADQVGATLTFRAQRGLDPEAARWSTDVTLDGSAGTFGFARASADLRFTTPLTPRLAGAVEVGGGTSAGRVPVQSRWYLGGPLTLRGYGGAATSGDAFWRARVEV
ncbi:MAG: hypothetical protein ACREMN_07795, partial [Gemmatimonadales bacterium]